MHFPHSYRSLVGAGGTDGQPSEYRERMCGLELYHLESDVGESKDVARENPDVVKRLQNWAETMRADLGDTLTKRRAPGERPAGRLEAGIDH